MKAPTLTRSRCKSLKAIEPFGSQPFTSSQVGRSGPSMQSLFECGWIEPVTVEQTGPFTLNSRERTWTITEDGLAALGAVNKNPPKWS